MDYKSKVISLERQLVQRDQERDLYMKQNDGKCDARLKKSWMDKHQQQVLDLEKQIAEYRRRDQICDRKWNELINQCEASQKEADELRSFMVKQRETYNKLLEVTEQRVIKANLMITQQFEDDRA